MTFMALLFAQLNAQEKSDNRSCSVVCLNDQWLPTSYEADAETNISITATGILSVHETFDVADRNNYNRKEFIDFKVAAFKKEIGSLISFSEETYQKIDVSKILQQCEKGDQIVILLKDKDHYSLPHYQIEVL